MLKLHFKKGKKMAHSINILLNKIEGKIPVSCNEDCKYWRFPHNETACVLSDVFSVKKGEVCLEFEPKKRK